MKLELPGFGGVHLIVVGDVLLDRYWYGAAERVSQEAPVPVVDVVRVEERPGGAANVALNIAALGASCTLVGVVGDDQAAGSLEHTLDAAGVTCRLIRRAEFATIVKLRVVSQQQQLLRMDFETPMPVLGTEIARLVKRNLGAADALVLEDYDKGTLSDPAALLASWPKRPPVLVDPKFKPFETYAGVEVIKPNLVEFRRAVGGEESDNDLAARGARLIALHGIGAAVVTRGGDGMTLIEANGRETHVPARPVDVFDTTGAGDTVAAAFALGMALRLPLGDCALLANVAAGIAVTKSGTATVSPPELARALAIGRHDDRGILSRAQLMDAVAEARRRHERIVFTNGCFDVLHAGHVAYLEEARALGDRLIVAVNDDASVTRLKGAGRPVNGIERRLKVLSALTAVDWVVPFAEDTPEALLAELEPDVLVKGGDYALDDVVGAEILRGYGGEVRVLGKVDDVSTTRIVERLESR